MRIHSTLVDSVCEHPAMFLYNNGEKVSNMTGMAPKAKLDAWLNQSELEHHSPMSRLSRSLSASCNHIPSSVS